MRPRKPSKTFKSLVSVKLSASLFICSPFCHNHSRFPDFPLIHVAEMPEVKQLKWHFIFLSQLGLVLLLTTTGVRGHVTPFCAGLLFLWGRGSLASFVVLDLQGEAFTQERRQRMERGAKCSSPHTHGEGGG